MLETTEDPSLLPLSFVDWSELDSNAVESVALGPDPPDDLHDALFEAVLDLGIGVEHDGEVVPTVAGAVAFGESPQTHLEAFALRLNEDRPTRIQGSLSEMLTAVGHRRSLIDAGIADVARLLVAHAFAHRETLDPSRPVTLTLTSRVLTLEYEPGPPMRTLFDLLVRRGILGRKDLGLKRVRKQVGAKRLHAFESDQVVRIAVDLELQRRTRPPRPVRTRPSRPRVVKKQAVSVPTQVQRAPRFVARRKRATKRLALEDRCAQVLAVVRREGSVARRELQAELGWRRSTLRHVLRHLVEQGRLATSAESRSPFQRYHIAGGGGG